MNSGQQTIFCTAGVHRELHDEFIGTPNGKPPGSAKESFHTICEIEHQNVVSIGVFKDMVCDKHPSYWTRHYGNTFENVTEGYSVVVIAECHM